MKRSDGDYHDILTITTALVCGAAAIARDSTPEAPAIAFIVSIVFGGLWLSPDLDLPRRGWRCKAWHRWQRIGLGWYWAIYPGLVGKHRSWLSHSLVIGSAVRLLYVAPLWVPIAITVPALVPLLPAIALGVEVSAFVHYWRDGIF